MDPHTPINNNTFTTSPILRADSDSSSVSADMSSQQLPQPSAQIINAPHTVEPSTESKARAISITARAVLTIGVIILIVCLTMIIWTISAVVSKNAVTAIGPAIIEGFVLLALIPIATVTIFVAAIHLVKGIKQKTLSSNDIAASIGGVILCLLPIAVLYCPMAKSF